MAFVGQTDVVTASILFRGATSSFEGDRLKSLLEQGLQSSQAAIRADSLYWIITQFDDDMISRLTILLVDRQAPVREVAAWAANRAGIDVAATYRRLLDDHPAESLAALVRWGETTDADLARPYIGRAEPRIRVAAVRLAARDPARMRAELLDAFMDPSPAVARAVAASLRSPRRADAEAILDLTLGCPHPHGRRAAVTVFRRFGKWDVLGLGLRALADGDEDWRGRGRQLVDLFWQRWNRTFTVPAAADREEMLAALSRASTYLTTEEIQPSEGDRWTECPVAVRPDPRSREHPAPDRCLFHFAVATWEDAAHVGS
jgi:hypothetical protein